MVFQSAGVSDARLILLTQNFNSRGDYAGTWCVKEFERTAIALGIVQSRPGALAIDPSSGYDSGMHFQHAPKADPEFADGIRYDDSAGGIAGTLQSPLQFKRALPWPPFSPIPFWLTLDDPVDPHGEPTAVT